MPIFQYRFGNGLQKLRQLQTAGIAGEPYLTSIETHWERGGDYFAAPFQWRGQLAKSLGGCLLAHAIHAHDLLNHVCGPAAAVQAFTSTRVHPNTETEDCAVATVRLANGSLATLSTTLGSCGEHSRLRFCFENLTAESTLQPYAPALDPWRFIGRDAHWQQRIDDELSRYQPQREGFVRQFELLYDALVDDRPLPVTLADGRRSLELVSALYLAAGSGQTVTLPLAAQSAAYHHLHGVG